MIILWIYLLGLVVSFVVCGVRAGRTIVESQSPVMGKSDLERALIMLRPYIAGSWDCNYHYREMRRSIKSQGYNITGPVGYNSKLLFLNSFLMVVLWPVMTPYSFLVGLGKRQAGKNIEATALRIKLEAEANAEIERIRKAEGWAEV